MVGFRPSSSPKNPPSKPPPRHPENPRRTRLWRITISLRCGGRRTNSHYHLVTGRGIAVSTSTSSLPWGCFFGGAGWDKKIYGIFKNSLSPDDLYLKIFLPRKRRFDWKGKLHEVPLPKIAKALFSIVIFIFLIDRHIDWCRFQRLSLNFIVQCCQQIGPI